MGGFDSSDQNATIFFKNLGGYLDHLYGGFARPKDYLRKALTQGTVLIHLRKTKIGNGLLPKRSQDFFLADFASTKLLEQLIGLCGGHARQYGSLPDFLQQKRQHLTYGHAGLFHCVPIAQGNGVL